MQRAGLATARLAMALAPHARTIWIACGPGNNGGDGFEAAAQVQQRGFAPVVTRIGDDARLPADAAASLQRARVAGVRFVDTPPAHADLAIDALLGLGAARALPHDRAHPLEPSPMVIHTPGTPVAPSSGGPSGSMGRAPFHSCTAVEVLDNCAAPGNQSCSTR